MVWYDWIVWCILPPSYAGNIHDQYQIFSHVALRVIDDVRMDNRCYASVSYAFQKLWLTNALLLTTAKSIPARSGGGSTPAGDRVLIARKRYKGLQLHFQPLENGISHLSSIYKQKKENFAFFFARFPCSSHAFQPERYDLWWSAGGLCAVVRRAVT